MEIEAAGTKRGIDMVFAQIIDLLKSQIIEIMYASNIIFTYKYFSHKLCMYVSS